MNSIVTQEFGILHETQAMRNQMMDSLTDADLTFKLPGNPTLGELCQGIGEIEHDYIQSFKTFKLDFGYRYNDPKVATSVERLNAWYKALDLELDAALSALSEEDANTRMIDRGGGFLAPPRINMHIYREALLIFYGRATVYLRALNKPLSQQIQDWIG